MDCPNAIIRKAIMSKLQVAMDKMNGRPTIYTPKILCIVKHLIKNL